MKPNDDKSSVGLIHTGNVNMIILCHVCCVFACVFIVYLSTNRIADRSGRSLGEHRSCTMRRNIPGTVHVCACMSAYYTYIVHVHV